MNESVIDLAARFARPLAPVVIVVGAALFWVVRGAGAGILVLAGGLVIAVIAALWQSVRVLTGDAELSLESTLALGEVTHEDEGKRAILRALKDLEYEHAVGKLSDDDFKQLTAQYRAEARKVLRALDASLEGQRKRATALLEERLAKVDLAPPDDDEDEPAEAEAKPWTCAKCETKNDADASFCKRCGEKLAS